MLKWVRWIAAAALALLAFVCLVGAVRAFAHTLPDATPGTGIFAAFVAAVSAAGVYFLVRPELRGWTPARFREWVQWNPLGQALALYLAAAVVILAAPAYGLLPAFIAQCVYSATSAWTIATRPRWWANAVLALFVWILLFEALTGTAEGLRSKSIGEGAMIFMLPMMAFPVFLLISGVVHWTRMRSAGARPS